MIDWPIISVTIFLPLIGSLIIFLIKEDETTSNNIKWAALWTSIGTFVLSCLIWFQFDHSTSQYQLVEKYKWFNDFNFYYHVGVDGISLFMILLSTFLTPFCILASWENIKKRIKEYMIAFLFLETVMIGMFCSIDILLFYVFFEAVLIPMFLIIGIWGGERRVYSAFKFFLYTLLGSVLMLVAIISIYWITGTTDVEKLYELGIQVEYQNLLWLAFFSSFAVKTPMWPVHTWLPDAHVEAPTVGSVLLAAILLKMAGYGFIRFSLGLFPIASENFTMFVYVLSLIAIIYTSLVALMQEDMKKLIAYSSVAHMGFVTLGIFTFTIQGIEGAIIQMISHGIVSAALFLCVGVVYDRIHTREIERYGGLVNRMPLYSFSFMIFILASLGLPGTSGFVGEFLVLLSIFSVNTYFAVFATTGVVLAATYSLWLYRKIIFGQLIKDDLKDILDLSFREIVIFVPLILLTIGIGIYPIPILEIIEPSSQLTLEIINGKMN